MISLLVLLVTIGLTAAFYVRQRSSLPHSKIEAMVFACLYCISLGLALRFGGRIYPGIHFPQSPLLNALLNGNRLFVGVGYAAVLVAFVGDSLRVLVRPSSHRFAVAMNGMKWLAVALAVTISFYGFGWAILLQRLP